MGDDLVFTVQDNGSRHLPRAMQNLFRVGYSTKFNPETGNISRGSACPLWSSWSKSWAEPFR